MNPMPKHTFAILITMCLLLGPSMSRPAAGEDYEFSVDWTKTGGRSEDWPVVLRKFKGKKNVHGLEIGSFEGRSAIWFLDNILTDSSSTLTCIDIFADEYEGVFDHNLRISGHGKRVIKRKGFSQDVLRTLKANAYDFIYIDGCHTSQCVYIDAALSWDLLKVGGVMMFDDWLWGMGRPIVQRPKIAIDAFLEAFSPFIRVIEHRNSHSLFLVKVLDSREGSADLWYIDEFYGKPKEPVSSTAARILRNERVPAGALNRWFVSVDRDHDGLITEEEYAMSTKGSRTARKSDFDAMLIRLVDADKDGRLGAAEALAGYGERMSIGALNKWLTRMDTNRDGSITRKEHLTVPTAGGEGMFDLILSQADKNKDGELTRRELIFTFAESSNR